jgi:hypothetical protein
LTISRIQHFSTERVGDGVLVGVTRVTKLDRVLDKKQGAIAAMGSVARSALEISVRLKPPLQPRGSTAGIVTREAQVGGLALEEALTLPGVWVVTGGTVRAPGRYVRKGC